MIPPNFIDIFLRFSADNWSGLGEKDGADYFFLI